MRIDVRHIATPSFAFRGHARIAAVEESMRPMNQLRILPCIFLLVFLNQAIAAKTDVVVLVNGNAVTGEIESLEFGSLRYSTDSMGSVKIDWEDVVGVTSNQQLQVELVNGSRYFGNLSATVEEFHVKVVTQDDSIRIPTNQIVRVTPIITDQSFWRRLEGDISFGLNSQKSSEVTTVNIASDIRYRTQEYLVGLVLNSAVTDQPTEETKTRQNLGLNYQRFRQNRWFTDWLANWESNDELGIQSRVSAGGAFGRYLVQTNTKQFSMTAGIVGTRASFTGSDESTTQAEGRFQVRYLSRHLDPDASFSFTTNIFPLLDDFSQYRAETDISFKREFVKDLFFEVLLYHSYVSDPPTGAESGDYGITTSLGYSF